MWASLLLRRALASCATLPTSFHAATSVGAALAGTAAFCLPFGLATGFLEPRHAVRDPGLVLKGCASAFLAPALLEEALFRAALLPHPATDPAPSLSAASYARAAVAPLALFVAYHLVNPREQSRLVFHDWRFLTLAAVLGAACSAVHWATGGSLLAAAVVHWAPVCVWLFGLGGCRRLGYDNAGRGGEAPT